MMWGDKSPGVKILWIWTIGTAAVLVTNVARTRMRDMEQFVKAQSQDQHQQQQQQQQQQTLDAADSVMVMTDHQSDSDFTGTSEKKL